MIKQWRQFREIKSSSAKISSREIWRSHFREVKFRMLSYNKVIPNPEFGPFNNSMCSFYAPKNYQKKDIFFSSIRYPFITVWAISIHNNQHQICASDQVGLIRSIKLKTYKAKLYFF